MRATISCELPEEKFQHELHLKGPELFTALHVLRKKIHCVIDETRLPTERIKAFRELDEMLETELQANGVADLFRK